MTNLDRFIEEAKKASSRTNSTGLIDAADMLPKAVEIIERLSNLNAVTEYHAPDKHCSCIRCQVVTDVEAMLKEEK